MKHRNESVHHSGDGRLSSRASALLAGLRESGAAGRFAYDTMSALYWNFRLWATRGWTDEQHIKAEFKAAFGYELDLENPVTYSEKLQYLKLYDLTPLHTQCADKIRVRAYVRERLSEDVLIPMVLATYDLEDINPEKISAQRFVVKPNHDSGSIEFCRDRNQFDWARCRRRMARALRRDFSRVGRELQYRDIRRGLIVEEMLLSDEYDLRDYKFYCFGGEPRFLQVDIDRFTNHRRNFFDMDWNPLDMQYSIPNANIVVPRPSTLNLMAQYARRLAEPFRFSRVDLYSLGSKVYFGEITFHPYSGFRSFSSREVEEKLGSWIDLGPRTYVARNATSGSA